MEPRNLPLYLKNMYYVTYSNFFFSKCRRVPKMSCKIEKRTVVKTKPESKCSRVPRQFCRKEDCSQKDVDENLYNNDPNCYYRNQIVSFFSHITHSWDLFSNLFSPILQFIFSKFCLFCFLLDFFEARSKESIDGAAD